MGRRAAFAAIVAAWGAAACSLLTSTDDLNKFVEAPGGDASATDSAPGDAGGGGPAEAGDDGTTLGLDTGTQPLTGDEYAAMVKGDGPIAYFRLADTAGTTAKDEMGAYGGTWIGTPDFGAAGPFTGTSFATKLKGAERVTADALANRSSNWSAITIEAWVSSELAPNVEGCFAEFAGADGQTVLSLFRDDTTNALKAHVASLALTGATLLTDSTWHHVAVTVDNTAMSMKLYLDGKVEAMLGGSVPVPTNGYFVIGADYNGLDGGLRVAAYFVGRLAEVAIYDKVLDASRIAAHRAARP